VKAVSFLPLLARLAIELGLFEEEERGGLLIKSDYDDNVLQNLMRSGTSERNNMGHHVTMDAKYLQVLMQLRKMGPLKKDDIHQRYGLLHNLCNNVYHYFPEKRFQFLVE
jgi:hypothetical protein